MFSLPIVESPLSDEVFELAIGLFRSAWRAGLTVPHRDRDFDALARIAPLEVRRI